jgi:isopenicillin N synthase-like dioxygenase
MKGCIKAFVTLEVLAVLSLHVYFNFLKYSNSSNDFINRTTAFAVVPPQAVIEESAVLPIIDITELLKIKQSDDIIKLKNNLVINQIGQACRHFGFFYISSSLFNTSLYHELDHNSHMFFDHISAEDKDKIHMRQNGKAWRGYFAVGDEFTSGLADNKEGIYFGKQDETNSSELLHGYNVYPKFMHNNQSYDMKLLIDNYMNEMESIGHALIQAIIVSLNLNIEEEQLSEYFSFQDPTILFRIFNFFLI